MHRIDEASTIICNPSKKRILKNNSLIRFQVRDLRANFQVHFYTKFQISVRRIVHAYYSSLVYVIRIR